jgi:hypothetical protein
MKRTAIFLIPVLMCGLAWPVSAKTSHPQRREVQAEPGRGFEEILDLWRDGKYDAVYERTIPSGKQSRESFVTKLSSAERKPACCWEKLQDVRVTEQDDRQATLHAKVGLEGKDGLTDFSTRQFKLRKKDGVWKAAASDILSLSGNRKKSSRRHYPRKKATAAPY